MAVRRKQIVEIQTQEAQETAVTTVKPVRIFQEIELSFTEKSDPCPDPSQTV